jgi:HEAT repeat protein
MALFGPPDIEKLKSKGNIGGLIRAQSNKNVDIRIAAQKALVEIGAQAVEPLIASLKSSDSGKRYDAAQVLGEIGDARAVEPLISALKDRRSALARGRAAAALGEIGDARAIEALIVASRESDEYVRGNAASALNRIDQDIDKRESKVDSERRKQKARDRLSTLPQAIRECQHTWTLASSDRACVLCGERDDDGHPLGCKECWIVICHNCLELFT